MIGYPLDSRITYDKNGIPVYDRAVTSAPLRKLTKSLFSDGVLPNPSTNLQVMANTDKITIKAGFALCAGCQKLQEADKEISLPASDSVNDRIDTVVLRLDNNEQVRECEFYIISGQAAATPIRPTLTQTESIWEIGLADIKRRSNSTEVTNADITDTRYETNRCGIISSISRFDTTTLYQQIQSDLEQFRSVSQVEFEKWFNTIKNTLSGDTAGNLQNQINSIVNNIGELSGLSTDDKTSLVNALNEIKDALSHNSSSIGNLSALRTTNKTNLVSAINELANKKIDVLDTAGAIKANITNGKVAGALGVKALFTEVNNRLGGFTPVIDSTGKITGYKTKAGADTVFPFKSGGGLIVFTGANIGDDAISATLPINDNTLKDKESFSVSSNVLTCLKNGTNVHILPFGSLSGYYNVHYGVISVTVYKNSTALSASNLGITNVVTLNKGDKIRAVGVKKDTKAYGSAALCIVHAE